MKKTIAIEGMTCAHCSARVEKALNAIEGVRAKVNLAKKSAVIETDGTVTDDALAKAVTDAGYKIIA